VDTNELLRRVRRVEIKTRALTNQAFAGEYHSAFKGRGMSFAEVREYQVGDDVRDIDWNVTARARRPYVKVFEEERELTVMLLIDVSASEETGSRERTLRELATELSATIALSALENNDKIGVILFSDRVERYIPPKKGRGHLLYIIRELLDFTPQGRRTDVAVAVEYLMRVSRRRCIAFVMSDFLCQPQQFSRPLMIAGRHHDVVGVHLYDPLMARLPDVGLLKVRDAETGHEMYIDSSSRRVRGQHEAYWRHHCQALEQTFRECRVDSVRVATNGDYVKALKELFAHRRA
jgi:uncharacterized protein (DUF58 family)